jgi:hypothetical protein
MQVSERYLKRKPQGASNAYDHTIAIDENHYIWVAVLRFISKRLE